jgi:Bacterial PH domain
MSYVQRVLQPGEVVRYMAGLHWVAYLPGLLALILAVIVLAVLPDERPIMQWIRVGLASACGAVGLVLIARTALDQWMTEIALTDRRVIYKTGIIWRNTTEMHMDKVESVEVKQSVLGRISTTATWKYAALAPALRHFVKSPRRSTCATTLRRYDRGKGSTRRPDRRVGTGRRPPVPLIQRWPVRQRPSQRQRR